MNDPKECKNFVKCPFFNGQMESTPATAALYKKRYCQGQFSECARFMVSQILGSPGVPLTLYPNEVTKARKIIGGAKS